jgi:hypothetical protein
MVTKSTFELVARIIRTTETDDTTRAAMAQAFASDFARLNPRFDRDRFLVACGVK